MKKNHFYTIGSLIILLICAFVFVILPVFTGGSSKSNSNIPAFGKYNGKEIRYEQGSDFANYVSDYAQMFQNNGQQMDQTTYYYIFNYAFDATVTKMAYEDAVKKSGYEVPETSINRKMIPYFYDENGKYSSKLYKQTPESTITELKENIESSLYSSRFHDDNFGSTTDLVGQEGLYGLKESDAELDFISSLGIEKRGFKMAVLPMDSYPESEKLSYAASNKDKFVKYDLSVITCEDKSKANQVLKRINNSEITFTDAVSEYSGKNFSNTEGALTNQYEYQIETILANKDDVSKITGLNKDDTSEVIETTTGFSIFKLNSAVQTPDFSDKETLDVVSNYLSNYESTIIEDYFTAKANTLIADAKASSLDAAAKKADAQVAEIAAFPLNYGNTSAMATLDTTVTGLTNADTNENFLEKAFSLKKDEISSPIVMNKNVVVLQYTTEEKAESSSVADLDSYDQNSANTAIMDSKKLENNFASTYFQYMIN